MKYIDLRSDTVTRPTKAMRTAMFEAEVGDDVYGEDPTVNELERLSTEMLGTESAIFASSGTQSNLLALMSHCSRGDEYIVGQKAHIYKYEGGGAAVLGAIQPQPLDFREDGTFDLKQVAAAVKPDDFHFARTKLLCLENTHNGLALPMDYFYKAKSFTEKYGLSLHLDGARIFNAAVKENVSAKEIAKHFDSISVCLSKGLGSPVGSVLCGTNQVIQSARRWRKVLGGGMRQVGILAAAGVYALKNHVERLAEDHENALILAKGLEEIEELQVNYTTAQTNMVFLEAAKDYAVSLSEHLAQKGILIWGDETIRLVTHLDINEEDIRRTILVFKEFFK
ncbi:MAG: low-specificity L-threonine aldolase [Desulfobacterales bacterium]|nr:low-specificity L-threonine aldolase [Desulfobacterales bacterium]